MSLLGEKFVYLFFEFIQNMKKFNFVCMSFFLLIDVSRQLEKECLLLAVRLSQSYISKWSLFLKIIVIIKVYKIISDHFNLSSKFNTKLNENETTASISTITSSKQCLKNLYFLFRGLRLKVQVGALQRDSKQG